MDFFNIIIDHVDSTFIFNLIDSRYPSHHLHLKNKVPESFIEEFLNEISNISSFLFSLHDGEESTSLTTLRKLKTLSETFFLQFFPREIITIIRQSEGGYLFFHIDEDVAFLPWDILHDGISFLSDRFRIGINIAGSWRDSPFENRSKLKLLILANPTKDLEESYYEGLQLFEILQSEISVNFLEIQLLTNDKITKLNFLSNLQNYDIIHYAGHVIHADEAPEGGILLFNDLIKSEEIERLSQVPSLVFMNACRSAVRKANAGLAKSFLHAGAGNYIGTNWNIPDSQGVVEFVLDFYRYIFEEKTVGDALYYAKKNLREKSPVKEIVWASYTLYGNPATRIFKYPEKKTYEAIRSSWNLQRIFSEFPTFLAAPYRAFLNNPGSYEFLFLIFERFFLTITGIIMEICRQFEIQTDEASENPSYLRRTGNDIWREVVECAKKVINISIQEDISFLIKSFLAHKEDFLKLYEIKKKFDSGQLVSGEDKESYAVSFQFLLENLFFDFMNISKIQFFYNSGSRFPAVLFKGVQERTMYVIPVFREDKQLKKFLDKHIGEVCMIIDDFYLSLHNFLEYNPVTGDFVCKISL